MLMGVAAFFYEIHIVLIPLIIANIKEKKVNILSKKSRSKRAIQEGKDAVQPANETEGLKEETLYTAEKREKRHSGSERPDHG